MRPLKDEKILKALKCPICASCFTVSGGSLNCLGERKHCYDLSACGHVNFCSPKQSGGGDSKQAVAARSRFLEAGHYAPVAKALVNVIKEYANAEEPMLDAGCGEGYYAAAIAMEGYSVLGVDVSKFAVEAASKRFMRAKLDNGFFAAASVFELPVKDGSIGSAVSVFAPCAEDEIKRVLKDNGILVVVWAGEDHLMGLKRVLYRDTRPNTERADLPANMEKLCDKRVRYTLRLTNRDDVQSLFSMTPYYWRTSLADAQRLSAVDSLETEVDMIISVYANREISAK